MVERLIDNRYSILKKLGIGSMGNVYLVHDRLNDQQTAVKIIHQDQVNQKNLEKFKQEFDIMTRLNHPNLVQVFDFGRDDVIESYYISMEYIQGPTLLRLIEGRVITLSHEEKLNILIDLCRALEFIDSRNIRHRDIKPANIILKDGKAMLVDFGLSDLGKEERKRKGTITYMAPETLKMKHDIRSEIFALGVTCYELFTGNSFFDPGSSSAILTALRDYKTFCQHKTKLFTYIDDERLKTVLSKMTAYDPVRRYAGCPEIIREVGTLFKTFYPVETPKTRESYITNAGFIGREMELATLKQSVKDGPHQVFIVSGEAGIGKSRLMSEFKKHCRLNNIQFIEGNCYERLIRPYNPFKTIIAECLLKAHKSLVTKYGPYLKKVVPSHMRLIKIRPAVTQDPRIEKKILNQNIIGFILDYAKTMGRPPLLYINDMQWVDKASLTVLEELLDRSKQELLRFPVYLSSREQGLDKLERIKKITTAREIRLTPFKKINVFNYINAVFGTLRIGLHLEKAVPDINKRVGGNPFFLQELIRSMVESGVIIRAKYHWDLKKKIADAGTPANLSELVATRIKYLNIHGKAFEILETLGLLNRKINAAELGMIIEFDQEHLATLVNSELVTREFIEDSFYYGIYHDLARETIIAQVKGKGKKHEYIAQKLEEIHRDNLDDYAYELAYHYRLSRNKEKAVIYLEKAADIAKGKFFNDEALILYDQLLKKCPKDDYQKRDTVLLKKGEIYYIQSKLKQLRRLLDTVIKHASVTGDKKSLGDAYYLYGRLYHAEFASNNSAKALHTAIEYYKQINDNEGILFAYSLIGFIYGYHLHDYERALLYIDDAMDLIQDDTPVKTTEFVISSAGMITYFQGDWNAAVNYLSNALSLAKNIDEKFEIALCHGYLGSAYLKKGDFQAASHNLELSVFQAAKIDAQAILSYFTIIKARLFYIQQRYDDAGREIEAGMKVALEIDEKDALFEGRLLGFMIDYYTGDSSVAIRKMQQMLPQCENIEQKAVVFYELWEITRDPQFKQEALTLFRNLMGNSIWTFYSRQVDALMND